MRVIRWMGSIRRSLGRGMFPPELTFFLELPWRQFVLSPEKLAARLSLDLESRVLEVGAGSGFYSATIARRVSKGRLELLDVQPAMLKKARGKLEIERLSNVGYMLADAGRLPFRAESFDLIFLVAVLGEVSNQSAFLSEAGRVLKPAGRLSISEHLPDPDFSSFARVRARVEKEGFECFERHGGRWSYTASFRKTTRPGQTPVVLSNL